MTVSKGSLVYNDALLDMWNTLHPGFSLILSNPLTCEPELPRSIPLQATMVPGSCNSIEGLRDQPQWLQKGRIPLSSNSFMAMFVTVPIKALDLQKSIFFPPINPLPKASYHSQEKCVSFRTSID